ncbi:YdcF family protein [Nodularia spumigena]|uniref:YdcF family protein n=1 Tax=Nodularia spumigena TaxID=70799 RepID=UPI00232CDDB8|nr:YdcF family protein [Nodularia spumigena]MDB9318831.1 YdcF family protein [Nodularia spumigena CS-590/01A]MDB9326390.1 YdcF family protein [Nodularia spumigena CS-590/02]MDB9337085.1 YdcF family protein [Nodularia spumigena CS-590/01]
MRHKFTKTSSISPWRKFRKQWQLLQKIAGVFCLILAGWLIFTTITLVWASSEPVDAFFVLGGSIRREIYVAEATKKYPQIPVLISSGSQLPCIWLIFQREAAELQNVWVENCANSTFENFYYGIPILRQWKVHKVTLITSPTHLPRAKWLAQILLGAHGIWVETDIVPEQGIPGNYESGWKTGLDVTRSLFWAVFSHIIQPKCSNVTRLAEVDMQAWQSRNFKCEHQGGIAKVKSEPARSSPKGRG